MKKNIILTGLLYGASLLFSIVKAQQVSISWENTIQANNDDVYLNLIKTSTNKLLLNCFSLSDSGFDKSMNPIYNPGHTCGLSKWTIMLDSVGNKIWDKNLNSLSSNNVSLVELGIDSFVLCARIDEINLYEQTDPPTSIINSQYNSGGIGSFGFDSLGVMQWNKRFDVGYDSLLSIMLPPPTLASFWVLANDVKAVDGSIYVLGRATVFPALIGGDLITNNCSVYPPNSPNENYPIPYHHQDMLLYKLNPQTGNKYEWQHIYGGDSIDLGLALLPLKDKGFLVGGITASNASCNQTVGVYNKPYFDWLLIRTDTLGNPIWQKRYGGSKHEFLNGIIQANDNRFLLYGYTLSQASYDVSSNAPNDTSIWMLMVDSMGNKLWDKRYSGCRRIYSIQYPSLSQKQIGIFESNLSAIQTSDGGFIFVTSVNDVQACGDVSEPGKGGYDYWLIKTDSLGNKLWDKRFGGPGDDYANKVVEMSPGHYVIGGISNSTLGGDKSEPSLISSCYANSLFVNTDIWLVGVTDSAAIVSINELTNANAYTISVSPNPTTTNYIVKLNGNNPNVKYTASIVNNYGQIIYQQNNIATELTINAQNWSTGIYILQISDAKGNNKTRKLVKW